jgi:predicted small secreted protein
MLTFQNKKEIVMRKISINTLLGICVILGAASLLSACNTTAGAGKDVSAVGHAVTDSAEKNK